jgi:hypothetical protein
MLLSERRQCRQSILPTGSRVISPALFVEGRGRHPFELMREHELEGTVAKRLADRYGSRLRRLKNLVRTRLLTKEGRAELLNRRRINDCMLSTEDPVKLDTLVV